MFESSYMGKKLKPNDTQSSTSSFESNKSSNEDSKADMETDMVSKPSSPCNQFSNSNHNPTPPLTDPEPKPSTPPKKAPSKHVPTFMEAPYWLFNVQNRKVKDRSKDKGVKCSQTLAIAIKLAFESFIQGSILQMWGPRDHLGPTFSVPRQHRQLANKFEKTSEFKDLQKEHKVTIYLMYSSFLPVGGGGIRLVEENSKPTQSKNDNRRSYGIPEIIWDLPSLSPANTDNSPTNLRKLSSLKIYRKNIR